MSETLLKGPITCFPFQDVLSFSNILIKHFVIKTS